MGEAAAFVRTDDPSLFSKDDFKEELEDSTPSKDTPDLELFCTPLGYRDHGAFMFDLPTYALHVYLLRCDNSIEMSMFHPWTPANMIYSDRRARDTLGFCRIIPSIILV